MADQDISRSEQATPYKLEKAKQKGQTPRSLEAAPAAVLLVAVVYLQWKGAQGLVAYFGDLARLLALAPRLDGSAGNLWTLLADSIEASTFALLPLLLALMGAGVAINMMQTGGVFSLQAVQPDVARINPAAGFKRLMSMRTLFNAGKAVVKTAVLSAVAYFALIHLAPQLVSLAAMPARLMLKGVLDDINSLGLTMGFALVIVALIDMVFSRADFAKKFMAQMAQFTTLQLTQQISTDTKQLISNDAALQSVGLIGKTVSVKQADGQVFSGTVVSLSLDGNSPTITVKNAANSTNVPNISLSQIVGVSNPS